MIRVCRRLKFSLMNTNETIFPHKAPYPLVTALYTVFPQLLFDSPVTIGAIGFNEYLCDMG